MFLVHFFCLVISCYLFTSCDSAARVFNLKEYLENETGLCLSVKDTIFFENRPASRGLICVLKSEDQQRVMGGILLFYFALPDLAKKGEIILQHRQSPFTLWGDDNHLVMIQTEKIEIKNKILNALEEKI